MSVNPFEPPRSQEAAAAAATGAGPDVLPEAALGELVASAPWVRWLARLTLLSVVLTIASLVATLLRATKPGEVGGAVGGAIVGLPMAILFSVLFRRYAAHAERLPGRQPEHLSGVLDGQRSIFKTYAIITLIMVGFIGLVVVIAVGVGIMGARNR
jgi:hypothetical protein